MSKGEIGQLRNDIDERERAGITRKSTTRQGLCPSQKLIAGQIQRSSNIESNMNRLPYFNSILNIIPGIVNLARQSHHLTK